MRPGQLPHSEGWGASRAERAVGMTAADCRRVHPQWRGWQRCDRLKQGGRDASAEACQDRIARLGSRYRARQGVVSLRVSRRFLPKSATHQTPQSCTAGRRTSTLQGSTASRHARRCPDRVHGIGATHPWG